jgi:AraC-like DNA-binding protein
MTKAWMTKTVSVCPFSKPVEIDTFEVPKIDRCLFVQTPGRSIRKGRNKLSLVKTQPVRRTAEVSSQKIAKTETLPFKQAFELLEKVMPGASALVVSTLPRGSLQIVQPPKVAEALLKSYSREFLNEDRLTWQAILKGAAVTAASVFPADHRFVTEFLQGNGIAFAAAVPLAAPILDGYPGALHVYRTTEQGDFTAEELSKLADLASEFDEIIANSRAARQGGAEAPNLMLTDRPRSHLFVFDADGKQRLTGADFETLDRRLADLMADEVKARIARSGGEKTSADRVQLPDSRGDLWTFRAVTYGKYPAFGDGSFVVFCLQPNCSEWATVRPTDVQADQEMARLIPAMKFMRQEFSRGPTLGEISKQVHLSPFHFHRRFAELLGLTPKHYLLECQIAQAKEELLARKKELSQIATDCGFAHQSHFTSRFKQAAGLTPTRWRRLASDTKRD